MKHCLVILTSLASLAAAPPAEAVPGGPLGTLPLGRYVCALPGDAAGPALRHVPAADFTIVSASSYTAMGRRGTYLLTGDDLAMTGGPHEGKRFERASNGFLYLIGSDDQPSALSCSLGPPPDAGPDHDCPDDRPTPATATSPGETD